MPGAVLYPIGDTVSFLENNRNIITAGGALIGALLGYAISYDEVYRLEGGPPQKQGPVPVDEEKKMIAAEKPDTVQNAEGTTRKAGGEEDLDRSEKSETSEPSHGTETPPRPVDTQIPETGMSRPNDIAVVVGIEEYKNEDIPDVEYALEDARVMRKYLTKALGFRGENIIYAENATSAEMTRIFGSADDPKGQLYNWVRPGESEVFVYYSGHGAPNPETGNAYFVPSNSNPSYLSQNGYPANQLYENLAKIPAKSTTVVVEACFSGTSEGGAVVQNVSPAILSIENPLIGMENALAFTAGAADQVSTWYNEKKHGLFTYYFLTGLRGAANTNGDREVTAREMETYLTEKVPYRARRLHNREQTPQIIGTAKEERVLVRYEGPPPAESQIKARLPATTTELGSQVEQTLSLSAGAKRVTEADGTGTLQEGDVILSANGSELKQEDTLARIVSQRVPGDELRLKIFREGSTETVSVTLGAAQ